MTDLEFCCDRISHTFHNRTGDLRAIDNLTLTVRVGEFVCIVGPSGCGKSTLLRIIAELLAPSEGAVVFGGPGEHGRHRSGLVFQDHGVFPWMSVLENVALGVFFPMLINTMTGVRQISPTYFDVAKSYGATRWKLFTRVVLPAAMPMILSGLRIGLNIALVVTISIEIVAASQGLGALIWLSWEVLRIEVLYAALFVTAALGVSFNVLMQFLLARLVPWAPKIETA